MNFADAAHQILAEEGGPLSSSEIARRAIAKGLINPKSDSPSTFVAAALRKDNRRRQQKDEEPRFLSEGNGVFRLK